MRKSLSPSPLSPVSCILFLFGLASLVHKRGQQFAEFLVVFILRFGMGMEAQILLLLSGSYLKL
jgi:hypothetical protein